MYRLTLFFFVLMSSCQSPESNTPIYQNEKFAIFPDRVVQGENVAEVISPTRIKSNYKSSASSTYSRLIEFKFSINEKDNELAPGSNHWVVIEEDKPSGLIVFGEQPAPRPKAPATYLPTNYEYTFKVDMSPVLDQFESQGYYEAFDGSRVAKDDFKGFYIAGGSEPMTWDFVNLGQSGLQLNETDEPGTYAITLVLNPYNKVDYADKEWELTQDISAKPKYESDQPLVDALFNLSLEEAILNIEPDSTLRTGAKWGGVWTRDVSYSILLAFAYHEPEVAKISLMRKVKRNRIIQDTGSGGAYPVSSDRTTWALAAWEIYTTTGDEAWLRTAHDIIKNTLDDDAKVLASGTGLNRGESSFLDWREQTYPKWMSNMDIYVSENLGTNVVHYQAHVILSEMAKLLGEPWRPYQNRAEEIKQAINDRLWVGAKGYYGNFLYGRNELNLSDRYEALGEALAILFDVANEDRARTIIAKSPLTPFGATCIYPQIPGIPPYHNNGIWPFVQSYWNLAAAKAGNEAVLNHGLAAIYRAGGLFLTNYENFVAESGDFLGTEINSHRMLWSMAGNLAMVHRVFMGISFEPTGIRFAPVVPYTYPGTKRLSNFRYRNSVLDITVEGTGNKISAVTIDGKSADAAYLAGDISGKHTVEIKLSNEPMQSQEINMVDNTFTLPNPLVSLVDGKITWQPIEGANGYNIYKDGAVIANIDWTDYEVVRDGYAEYKVSAVDDQGVESFTSEPVVIAPQKDIQEIDMSKFADRSDLPFTNFTGKGFVEISNDQNREINLRVNTPTGGTYLVDIRYSNGEGPWNTENKCAIRSLYANGDYTGAMVFPQRGTDEWSDWGYSNSYVVSLKAGNNDLSIKFDPWNINMNVEVNRAMLDHVRLIKM
ncbi:MAG: glycogen debranching protein [Cyclobacteriaceae bacterium]